MSNNYTIKSFKEFIGHIKSYSNAYALRSSDSSLDFTYDQLYSYTQAFGSFLSKKIKPGQRITLLDIEGPRWVIAYLSILLNMGIVVPIDKRMSKSLTNEIINLVGSEMIITANQNNSYKIPTIVFDPSEYPTTKWVAPDINPSTPAEIIFTSGTWGKPKCVVLTHGNLLSNLRSVVQVFQPKPKEKTLSVLPLAHAYEQMCGLLVPLYSGVEIIYQRDLDSLSLLSSLAKFQPHYMIVVPRLLEVLKNKILESAHNKRLILNLLLTLNTRSKVLRKKILFRSVHRKFGNNLHTFIVGGAPLSKEVDRFFRRLGFDIIVGYGLSESSPVLTMSLEKSRPPNSVGFPIPDVKIESSDDGEVVAKGPNISPGYWPLDSEENKNPQILYTGDMGYLDNKGRLILTGRKRNRVVFPTGDKIQFEDIEEVANQMEGVDESCALCPEKGSPKITLVYTGNASEKGVFDYINKRLPIYAKLHKVTRWYDPKLPASHTLKLQRNIITDIFEKQYLNKKG